MKENPLNNYATKMAEINLGRNPTSVEAILVTCGQERDHYQDTVTTQGYRVKKRIVVKKNPTMHYVQFEQTDLLLEDTKDLPWVVSMTILDVQRMEGDELVDSIPRADDRILIDGILYSISAVEPANRYLDGLVNCTIYPERSYQDDPLELYRVDKSGTSSVLYSVIWGGKPVEYSLNDSDWLPFASYFRIDGALQPSELWVRDETGLKKSIEL